MAFAPTTQAGGMKWGSGYRTKKEPEAGGKEEPMPHETDANEGGEEHHAAIHEHLKDMHAQTGEAHSHVEHHGDGTHTSHHVHVDGNVSGPHHHENSEALMEHMSQMHGGGDGEQGDMEEGM